MNNLKINFTKEEPQKRNHKVLKEFAKFAKKKKRVAFEDRTVVTRYCSQTGVKGHKAEMQLPFHYDSNINAVDVFFAPFCFTRFHQMKMKTINHDKQIIRHNFFAAFAVEKVKSMISIKLIAISAVIITLFSGLTFSQSFAPAPGNPGSTAMHRDSSAFIDWASEVTITRGYLNIQNPGLGNASYGTEADALGYPDGTNVVSLGDGGVAILTFQSPIINGVGPDFAVFENGFTDHYMEFAFVEVSSDGINFFRFDAVSETPTDDQITNTSFSDCAYIHNLSGKYRQNYGTPFDLEELNGTIGLDVNNITHIKLIDVVGTIDPAYATYDSQGNIINDPYPTEFPSGGFDLDAVGVIHSLAGGLNNFDKLDVNMFPNPSTGIFVCNVDNHANYSVLDLSGRVILSESSEGKISIDLTDYPNGVYYLNIESKGISSAIKLLKL